MTRLAILLILGCFVLCATGAAWWFGRGRHDPRTPLSLALRALSLGLVVVALAEPYLHARRARMSIVCLLDVSESVSHAVSGGRLGPYLHELSADSEFAAIAFAADSAVVATFVQPSERVIAQVWSHLLDPPVARNGTDVEGAVRAAADLLPPSGDRRILLITDGGETIGDASSLIPRLRAEGISVSALPIEAPSAPDVRVQAFRLPPRARPFTPVAGQVVIESNFETDGDVEVYVDRGLVASHAVHLMPGRQAIDVPIELASFGEAVVTVRVGVSADTNHENDLVTAYVRVEGRTRALWVRGRSEGPTAAEQALRRMADVVWSESTPGDLPTSPERLDPYDAVVFDNVSADALSKAQMDAVEAYVRDLGGGWLAIGGPNTYGAGNWQGTPLEAAAPVEMVPQDKRKPLALMLLLDKSGSMAHASGGVRKLTLAAWATRAALDALGDDDRMGVIGFDARSRLLVPPSPISDRAAILRAVEGLRPGSGTAIVPALEEARKALTAVDTPRKHVILLSDGQSAGDMLAAARALAAEGITVSAVAVGVDAAPVLGEIAVVGGGSFYSLANASGLPRVLDRETRQHGDFIVQERTTVEAVLADPLVSGVFSTIEGYVASTPKPAARVLLRTVDRDPILAGWRFGLGRALVFLSDGGNRWTQAWVNDDAFAARWESWLRWTVRDATTRSFDLLVSVVGSELVVRAEYPPGDLPTAELMPARLRPPDGEAYDVALTRVDGGFEGRFPLDDAGPYEVAALPSSGGVASRKIAYLGNAEYLASPNTRLLRRLTSATGGSIMPKPAKWARQRAAPILSERRLSGWLLLAALALVLAEWIMRQWRWTRFPLLDQARGSRLSPLTAAKLRATVTVQPMSSMVSPPARPRIPTTQQGLARLHAAKSRARI